MLVVLTTLVVFDHVNPFKGDMSSVLVNAEGMHAQGMKDGVTKKRKAAPTSNDDAGELPATDVHEYDPLCMSHAQIHHTIFLISVS